LGSRNIDINLTSVKRCQVFYLKNLTNGGVKMKITDEMNKYYFERTDKHIRNVCEVFLKIIGDVDIDITDHNELYFNIANHDSNKFSEEEREPYTIFTWKMKNKEKLTPEEQENFNKAWKHHYMNETHHPERHQGNGVFSKVECIEIFCDLQAMSIEFNEGSCRKFFETKWQDKLQYYKEGEREKVRSYISNLIDIWESL